MFDGPEQVKHYEWQAKHKMLYVLLGHVVEQYLSIRIAPGLHDSQSLLVGPEQERHYV